MKTNSSTSTLISFTHTVAELTKEYKNVLVLNMYTIANGSYNKFVSMEISKTQGNMEELSKGCMQISSMSSMGYVLYKNAAKGEILKFATKTTINTTSTATKYLNFIVIGFN